ncbi:hypothetical protein [Pseudomonas sp. UBA1879]|uniref:hypothetical protein n=1 Tax=Pseudomonas sp. UBA1879 TaxID=1947305 RepID=UPI0025DDE281|nr:hypothetical protein [Pseudomonas sp. UBA1879]
MAVGFVFVLDLAAQLVEGAGKFARVVVFAEVGFIGNNLVSDDRLDGFTGQPAGRTLDGRTDDVATGDLARNGA